MSDFRPVQTLILVFACCAAVLAATEPLTKLTPAALGFKYGAIVTLEGDQVAEACKVPGPGVYVVNKQGEFAGAVSGGLGIMWDGAKSWDGATFGMGWTAVRKGIAARPIPWILTALVLIGGVVFLIVRAKRRRTEESAPVQAQASAGA